MRQTLCIIMLFALSASTLGLLPPRIIGMDQCITEANIPADFEIKLESDPVSLLSDPTIRCYTACILTDRNVLNDDGTLNVPNMIETISDDIPNRENVIAELKTCANEAGQDSCETAYKTIVCTMSKNVRDQEAMENVIGMDECITDGNIPADFDSKLESDPESLLSDPTIRCYTACILTDRNVLNVDGTLNVTNMIETIPHDIPNRENVIAELKTCANDAGQDSCETAYKTIVCMKSKNVGR